MIAVSASHSLHSSSKPTSVGLPIRTLRRVLLWGDAMYGWPWKCGNCKELLRQKRNEESKTDSYWCYLCRYGFHVTYSEMTADELNQSEKEYWEALRDEQR